MSDKAPPLDIPSEIRVKQKEMNRKYKRLPTWVTFVCLVASETSLKFIYL